MLKRFITSLFVSVFLLGVNANADVDALLKEAAKSVKSVDTKKIQEILKKDPNTLIIDVRTRGDILNQGGFIKANKVRNISRDKLEFLIAQEVPQKDTPFIVHCYTGNISLLAAKQLENMGYTNVIHYKDSYQGWEKAGLLTSSLDRYRESMLYRPVEKVADGVYTSDRKSVV